MLRKAIRFFLSILFLISLIGCGGGGGGNSTTSSSPPAEETIHSATLTWETPVSLADGKPLADLAGFNIYYGGSSQAYSETIDAGNVRTYTLENLPAGTYYIAITAYDSAGNETEFSSEVKTTVP